MFRLISKLSKRERYAALISIGIVLFLIIDKLVISQIINKLRTLNEEILVLENKLEKSRNIVYQEETIISEYEKYIQNIKKHKSDEEAIVSLLSEIEKIANETSVRIVDMKPSPAKTQDFFTKYTIIIEAEAEMSCMIDFTYKLEKTNELFRISEFRISPARETSSVMKVYMVVTQVQVI